MYSRSLCDSNLQGTNKRNDKESRWESFLLCSTNFSSFFLFFSIFRMTSTNRHHIILFYWTWRTNCIYPLVRKKSIVFPDDRRFELLWSDSKFSYHISIKEYTKFFAYIVCLDLNLWILVKKWMKLLYSHILINFFSLFVFCNTDSCDPMFNFPLE